MNIIIPACGLGQRFKDAGYILKKPLIKIFDKEMILYTIDNLQISTTDKIFIIHNDFDISETIKKSRYNDKIFLIKLDVQTRGSAETILLGLTKIMSMSPNKKTVLMDCDTFYTQDILEMFRLTNNKNVVFYTKNYEKDPIYSYISMSFLNQIIDIKEKIKISDNANTGIYCFTDISELYTYCKKIVDENIRYNNEFYTSCVIYEMISSDKPFYGIELNSEYVFNLGTPKQLKQYIDKTYIFLFDLDGTLINTDDIYFDIWTEILKDYNIILTSEIFKNCIQGQSDSSVINNIIRSADISSISSIKDSLFVKYVDKIRVIPGSLEFILQLNKHGHKIGIVTNCNRITAEEIIQEKFNKEGVYIDQLIIGSECIRPKPHPDPYQQATSNFNSTNDRVIIFEDSATGLLSATGIRPKCLIGLETIYKPDVLKNYGTDFTIKDYSTLDYKDLINFKRSDNIDVLKKYILQNFNENEQISEIIINDEKLKGGFISDVLSLQIIRPNSDLPSELILKLENKNKTVLSDMAQNLDLYDREYYFYESISKYVPISTPKCHGIIKDDSLENIGILMTDLNKTHTLNLNLNKENVNVSLEIIDKLTLLHAKFFRKDLSKIFKGLIPTLHDLTFRPKFIKEKWPIFQKKWSNVLSVKQLQNLEIIVNNYENIQNELLSGPNLTLCHGDVKSANIFYKNGTNEPCFIDWQYVSIGHGTQDLIFFMIESFDIYTISLYKDLFIEYYYLQLLKKCPNMDYNKDLYIQDLRNSVRYFPILVAFWFGTLDEDVLIDKNFATFFIHRLMNFIDLL